MTRTGWFALANGIYWLLLGLWIGSLVLSGAAAGLVFSLMKDIAPVVPEFEQYTGLHSTLVAGRVMSSVFFVQDVIELLAMTGVILILIGHFVAFKLSMRAKANVLRLLVAALLLLLVSYKTFVLAPRMYHNLGVYWTAAQAGEIDKAETAKAAFDADHPTARTVMIITFGLLVVFYFASAAALAAPVAESPATPGARRSGQLEEPELLKRVNS
ncbi:MAG: hypothetical protein IT430_11315 [Phycisphaerales bacterium]|nr:hypothetical protein [Phycisphaerales bacterium]